MKLFQNPRGLSPVPAIALTLLTVGGVVGLVAGCGGSGNGSASPAVTNGRSALTFTIHWPKLPDSRVIPSGAKSLRVTVFASEPDFEQKVSERLVARPEGSEPTTEVTLDNLPTRTKLRVSITAYPELDGKGVAQAVSTQDLTTGDIGSTVEASITLGSTISRVEAQPSSVAVRAGTSGGSATVTVTAFDAEGNVVPTTPESWSWISENPAIAAVSATGNPVNIGGTGGGSTIVTATNSDSGKTVTVSVSVTPFVGPPGCRFEGQLYGDECGRDENGTRKFWNCETGECAYLLPK